MRETKNDLTRVRDAYTIVAADYAEKFVLELATKPLDRAWLDVVAEEAISRGGVVADVGTGSGQIARYMHDRGARVLGIDVAPGMVDAARMRHAGVEFRVGNMLALDSPPQSFVGVTAFYAIVHLVRAELREAFREIHRVLVPEGVLLVAFHAGDETLIVEEFLGHRVDLAWNFFSMETVVASIHEAGLVVEAQLERRPYAAEHATTRGYVLARRPRD